MFQQAQQYTGTSVLCCWWMRDLFPYKTLLTWSDSAVPELRVHHVQPKNGKERAEGNFGNPHFEVIALSTCFT